MDVCGWTTTIVGKVERMTTLRGGLVSLSLGVGMLVAPPAYGQTSTLFAVAGEGKLTAEVRAAYPTGPARDPIDPAKSSPMLRRLEGVLADLDDAEVRALRGSLTPASIKPDVAEKMQLWAVVRLRGAKGKTAEFEIRRDSQGMWIAMSGPTPDDAPRAGTRLDAKRLFEVTREWEPYRGDFETEDVLVPQQVIEVAQPLAASLVCFDKALLGRRFLHGRPTSLEGTTRNLTDEHIALRLPKDYDARTRVGALVWVHADGDLQPPSGIFAAADALNLAVTSVALAGNERFTADRYQLMLDALQTLVERVHVDPKRVYTTGISGGGKIAGNLACCLPDVFAGSVPIVGLEVYENIPIGNGRWWPGGFDKPLPEYFKLLKTRRLAPITGTKDFNRGPILGGVKLLERDGIAVKLFDIEELAHQMPTPETFTQALEWVDEPARTESLASEKAAEEMLGKIAEDADAPAKLVELTRKHAWTKAAWTAAQRLGFIKRAQPR